MQWSNMDKATPVKVLSIFGTRPEAIKMAPLVKALNAEPMIDSVVCATGQHRQMLNQVLELFDIKADRNLDVMVPDQTLNGLSSKLFAEIDKLLAETMPDRVLVHGDTTTAMVAALAAFHRRIPVGHVEAGLRTHDLNQPWPEEMNRRTIDVVSDLMFAPTAQSRRNLEAENLQGRVLVTGNTVIDALQMSVARIESDAALRAQLDASLPPLDPRRKLLLVTGHRRENFGAGFAQICSALGRLARRDDLQIVYPVHLNPNVREPVMRELSGLQHLHLIEPLDYFQFVRLMQQAHVILTDSGGVQEEAPALGKPVLVMRDVTERPEAVAAGTVQLVGTDVGRIVDTVATLQTEKHLWKSFARKHNPYGDGRACGRIVDAILGREVQAFVA
ncbi:UDP-N-acetylglucosamine 2-epimerase (non-hydrolyzing) [Herbaspirillum sp. WKF16]|uniref:non-hydrolyzing UDP-N-acetylglucosamine 2-epimerase n=1 Tax=Herbaspirillum sp. WKF16 TaxID=3028312 RepID=UPI0023A9C36F|nr:UDP-N-acetylglucosamine 2-epimerase (non-hydrolyzing) [Herbaspirillum sp. WKF16]WDZ96237.1 UDP-N-acetylglucosamine 2-epimerase (non-hydrolyzing) [Herbaspirillum sp. WKF16]